jgi:acetyl esterase/lipase
MKSQSGILVSLVLVMFEAWNFDCMAQLPQEQPLWPNGISGNPVKYKEEKLIKNDFRKSSMSQLNRVFSCVSEPTCIIHKPEKGKGNGVAVVICPGGGFHDVWFDREGNDFGLWLAQRGITSLILKYRTFNSDAEGFKLSWNEYMPHVYADAKQAIYILRSQAKELGIDENKIGIGGFSAGGSLSLRVALGAYEKELPSYAFFNQGLDQDMINLAKKKDDIPPVFMMNGGEDKTTICAIHGKQINCFIVRHLCVLCGIPGVLYG